MSADGLHAGRSALRRLLGSACGAGHLPGAPGTWGSLVTVLLLLALSGLDGAFAGAGVSFSLATATGLVVVLLLLGVVLGGHAARDYGTEDPGAFVLDEVVGQLVALLPVIAAGPGPLPPLQVALALLLFRAFDIAKPPPCRALEELPGGAGIMADDVMAGLYAAGLLVGAQAAGLLGT